MYTQGEHKKYPVTFVDI